MREICTSFRPDPQRNTGIHRWATYHQPAMLPPVPTDERLSFAVDQFTGSGQHAKPYTVLDVKQPRTASQRFGCLTRFYS